MNHYEILGVGPDATEQQIKEAYRRQAMKWHPDRHDGAAAKGEADRRFKDLAVAYRTLRNPLDRANYDRQLEQKLRQEYEARRKEQAQQNQTRQAPPKPNFADTDPKFEEQTTSNDDANKMFYEQMLDLAFELAGRGFPELNIFKVLIALGCPEVLAKAVAATAAKQGQSKGGNGTSDKHEEPLPNFDDASFEEMEPYYVAAIMGSEPLKPISDERYDAMLAIRKRRGKFWLGFGVVVLVIGLVTVLIAKKWELFAVLIGLELVLVVLWVFSRNLFLGPDKQRFFAEETKRYYLACFRSLHQEKLGSASQGHNIFRLTNFNGGSFIAAFGWFGYRRLHALAFIWAVIYAAFGYAIAMAESSGILKLPSGISMGLAVGFSAYANRLYFNKVRSNIINAFDQTTQSQALSRLRKGGGTNKFGWILPWVFFILLCIPLGVIIEEAEIAKTRIAQEQHSVQVTASQPRIESIPPIDAYITYTMNLPRNVRFQQVFNDMGVKFPMQFGTISFASAEFSPQHFSQANLLEETQTIAHNNSNSENNSFILFQNRTYQGLRGIVIEVQAEERSCKNKGGVYFMNLVFEKVVQPGAVVGVKFTFPPAIPNANRCIDIVDLIYE